MWQKNLEREDRLFLRKAEAALPKIVNTKLAPRKPLREKSYYRWLILYLEAMIKAEKSMSLKTGSKGIWSILLEEEIRALDYYEPVLGLPDTIKAKELIAAREEMILKACKLSEGKLSEHEFDFQEPIETLKKKEKTN